MIHRLHPPVIVERSYILPGIDDPDSAILELDKLIDRTARKSDGCKFVFTSSQFVDTPLVGGPKISVAIEEQGVQAF